MRDLIVLLLVFGSIPFIFYRPYIGVLVWAWLGYMNPHRLTYGFAMDFPFAQIVAIVTMVAMVISKESKKILWSREIIVLAIFLVWMLITTLNAQYFDFAWEQYTKILKIQIMTFITLMIMGSKDRLILLAWVIAVSIGFFGVKGGYFTIATGGAHRVQGPPNTFIGGNNEIGLALIMAIPMMRYLQLLSTKWFVKYGLAIAMFLTAVAIVGTHSRGALVGGAAMVVFLLLKSRKKFVFALMLAIALPVSVNFMPDKWFDRMDTIETYAEDKSALGRINAWYFAFNVAKDRVTGGGFESFQGPMFRIYAPDPYDVHDAHSIYFEVMGEQGFIGLIIFVLLGFFTWQSAQWVIKNTKGKDDLVWASDLMSMIQVCIVGYSVGGLFLGLAYFDLIYQYIAIVVIVRAMVTKELEGAKLKNDFS